VKKWGFLAMIAILAAASVSAANLDFFSLVENGPPQAVQSAIDAGANVNASNKYSETPLMYAAADSVNPDVVTALLEAGADAKTVNVNRPGFRGDLILWEDRSWVAEVDFLRK
jgi:ankyrin repeat protein